MLGLVMTAGGARGAYQVGVLKRVAELPVLRGHPSPFPIVTGASAGAINGTLLAAHAARFTDATHALAHIWSELRVEQVFRTDLWALAKCAGALARDFALGGFVHDTVARGFFDTAPLEELLRKAFPPRGIEEGIRKGHLYAVAVAATSYHSGRSYTFVQGRRGHPVWTRARRTVVPVTLSHRHVLASGAIPAVFPPVCIRSGKSELWFGDGGLRLVTPMSPAIRLGATHVFAVGIRSSRAAATLADEEAVSIAPAGAERPRLGCPPLAQICGVFMNAIFLDHLDADLDHLKRMNDLLDARRGANESESKPNGNGARAARDKSAPEDMRRIEPLVVSPSEDIALIAQRFAHRMPRVVRYALDGLGTPDAQSADLMSYLLFDAAYTRTLVDLGYRDAAERIDEIESFLARSGALAGRKRRGRIAGSSATPRSARARVLKLAT
jgi:NTE family protein